MGLFKDVYGEINERRRRFISIAGDGDVHFRGANVSAKNIGTMTTFTVDFDDGRKGFGKYRNPKNVMVRLKVKRRRR